MIKIVLLLSLVSFAHAKNFAHIHNGKIVTYYGADKPQVFGGPWSEGFSIEIPENINPERAAYIDGVIVEKERTQEQAEDENLVSYKEQLKAELKSIKKSDLTSNAKTVEVLMKILEVLK